jgi:hypothetical protein
VTTDTSFGTTGNFFMRVRKLTDATTNLGQTPVYVEFAEYQSFREGIVTLEAKYHGLLVDTLETWTKDPAHDGASLSDSTLTTSEARAVTALYGFSSRPMGQAPIFLYGAAKEELLCHLARRKRMTPFQWKAVYDKVEAFHAPELKNTSEVVPEARREMYCADGGPKFRRHDRKNVSFEKCMCGTRGRDTLLTTAMPEADGRRLQEILARTNERPAVMVAE